MTPHLYAAVAARAEALDEELRQRRRRCQRNDLVGVHTPLERVVGRVRDGLGIKSGLQRIANPPAARPRLGAPSRFAAGDWVRVIDAERLKATLEDNQKLRGLAFVPSQWSSCGHVYRVHKPLRRMVDDHGRMRAVSRTVLLEGVTCDGRGEGLGCGRHCPMMYRDDWLEPAAPPSEAESVAAPAGWARVRPLAEIEATLDGQRRTDGVTFMPEMARHAGKRFPLVRRLPRVYELDRWTPTRGPVYLLEKTHCTGASIGADGSCDRACALLWHGDWLVIEPTVPD